MITLTILRGDSSIYWTEHFNDERAALAWIDEERTRPYWGTDFTYSIHVETPPAPAAPDLWDALRARRSELLSACDWTQLPDTPLESAKKIAWESYRQALRDLPEQTIDPSNPNWPVAPN